MSDELSNATRVAALEEQVEYGTLLAKARKKRIDELKHALDERNAYAERLLAENVRLSNEAAFMRSFINNEDVRSDFQTVTQMRQALDRERERCGVLEREVKAWHAAEHLRKDEWHAEFGELVEARWNTARTHALDAAKFVGGG